MTTVPTESRTAALPAVSLTESAAKQIADILGENPEHKALRIYVETGGCSGMSYVMDFVPAAGPGDEVVTDKGVSVVVDRKASLFLIGTVMDYEAKALSAGFTFTNPNEKGRCGCGESFHV